MSKKQQTLFQSWQNGPKTTEPNLSRTTKPNKDSVILDSDEDDDLLRQALEESLREYESNNKNVVPSISPSSSTSGYSTETTAGILEEHLSGFDMGAGDTWFYPTNKSVRKYQRDIVETCLFHNTLVTLPTGLGKTFIAAVVMYNFFRWYPRGKIIFMAPTKPLVAQQIQACYEIMGLPLDATSEMTGAMNPADRKAQWKEKRVFFLTPQILTNDISRAACPASEVKCLVLDEAHKALGNYAYVQVVQELCKHGAVFRILALSATPGSDLKAIQQVIVNLRISKLEVRNEESPDIVPYVHARTIDKVVVPLGPEITQVRDTFLNIFSVCARRLMESGVLFSKDIGSLTKYMLLQSRDKFRQNPPDNFPRSRSGMIEGDFALCITLTHALELLLQHGIRGFYNFLAGKTDAVEGETGHNRTRTELFKVNGFSQMMSDLKSKFGNDCQVGSAVSHPKLTKLKEIVLEHFQKAEKEGRPTRVMIFSQYRDSVNEIVALLEEYTPLIKAMSFVGHGNGSGGGKTKGFTQADQIRVIKQFSEGNYNTLVSTCVGEEGLDIGDVDMIICYDVHKSPVRLVQRCGRTGRKRDGRIVMLMTEGKEEHVHNQSMYQKKNLLKNIVGNPKLKEFLFSQEPRLIPRHLSPRCHEMPMHIAAFPPPMNRPPKNTGSSSSNNITSASRKSRTTKCYYLSDTEMDYWARNFQTNQPVPVLPESNTTGSSSGVINDKPTLSLNKWSLWQHLLQPSHTIGHSTLTENYVNILEHIQSQRDEWDDNYQQRDPTDVREIDGNVISSSIELPLNIKCNVISLDGGVKKNFSRDSKFTDSSTSHSGLYSQDFLDLFQKMSTKIDCPNIPSPPPFCFDVSPDRSTASPSSSSRSFHQSVAGVREQTTPVALQSSFDRVLQNGLSSDRSQGQVGQTITSISDVTTARLPFKSVSNSVYNQDSFCRYDAKLDMSSSTAQTPPKSELESSTFFLEPSPILSQRRKKGPVKRSLEWATSTPAPAKRLKMDGTTPILQRNPEENIPVCNREQDVDAADVEPSLAVDDANESILSVTQIVNLLETYDDPVSETKKVKSVQPNFELEVDFLDSSESSLSPLPCCSKEVPITTCVTPPKRNAGPSNLSESPVFDFMDNTPSPSPVRPKSRSPIRKENTPEVKLVQNKKAPVVVKAEFSLDFPDSWDDEDVIAPSPLPEPAQSKLKPRQSAKSIAPPIQQLPQNKTAAIDIKSSWDEGFELNLSDLEDIELLEKDHVDQKTSAKTDPSPSDQGIQFAKTSAKQESPVHIRPALTAKDSSGIRREMEDIFGPDTDESSSIQFLEKTMPVKQPTPPVFNIESDEDMIASTPPKPITISEFTPLRPIPAHIETSDEDSPLLCRKLNSKRNPLMTQSTPIAQKREPTVRGKALVKSTKNDACSFLDEEADLSLVDGSCSPDELEETGNGDRYEGSFVDDVGTQAVNETMRAVYLESVKSPVARQGFIFRQPARQMNHSEIFSQAVVDQDSEYAFDSFCVDSDDAEQLENTNWDEPHLTQLPPRAARARAQQIQANRKQIPANRQQTTSANIRRRKRIIFTNSSSDENEDVAPPPKKSVKSETSIVPQRAAVKSETSVVPQRTEVKSETSVVPQRTAVKSETAIVPHRTAVQSETAVVPQRTFTGSASTSNKLGSIRVEPTTKLDVKKVDIQPPVNVTSMVPATDRAVFPKMPSSSIATYKPVTTDRYSNSSASSSRAASCSSSTSSASNSRAASCSSSASSSSTSSATPLSPPRTLLISSRQVATTTQVISSLQVKHRCLTHVCSFDVADFVLSSQLGVIRKLHSEFTNGSSRCRLQDQVRRLAILYDKPYLIVEADRTASRDPRFKGDSCPALDASSVIFKPNTPYFLQTLATLAQTDLSVLYSESQEHTARLLNDLGRQETLRGLSLPRMENLNSKQDGILKFLQRIPEINPAVSLLMASQFKSLREILCSSVEVLSQRCKISPGKARTIVQAFRVNHAP